MPGVNLTGLPQSSDIVLGRGALYFALLDPTTRKPLGFRHLGNATAFTLNVESETLEHFSSRTGIKSIDRELVLSQKCGVSLTLDEINFQNIALFLSGTATAGVANPATSSISQALITSAGYEGYSYDLLNASGARIYDTTGTLTVKSGAVGGGYAGATTRALNTDYTVDSKWGTIHMVYGGGFTDGHAIWIDYTPAGGGAEKAVDQVDLMTQTSIAGFLRFKMINAANSDKQMLLDLHSVTLKADGEMPLISDEFTTMTLTGSAERNETGYPTSPVGRFYTHADA